jgi:transcription antitermination factor NusA-like protein
MRLAHRHTFQAQLVQMARQIQEMAEAVLELLMPEVTDGTVDLALLLLPTQIHFLH